MNHVHETKYGQFTITVLRENEKLMMVVRRTDEKQFIVNGEQPHIRPLVAELIFPDIKSVEDGVAFAVSLIDGNAIG
jgi:hypothetical protein